MQRNYKKLSIEQFGTHLLETMDLDPIYVALNKCVFKPETRNRWLTAYCAFYNAGFASYACERVGKEYWDLLLLAAENAVLTPFGERWPRASERRHFRGSQAILAIKDWQARWPIPEQMMDYIAGTGRSFTDVLVRAKEHRSVGNWLGFKIVDLVDACMGGDIGQDDVMQFMYEAPRTSLLNLWRNKYGFPEGTKPKNEPEVITGMVNYFKEVFKNHIVPHKGTPIDMFSLETCFCKYQSHLNGHYPLFNDIREIKHGLIPWLSYSEFAKQFHEEMPKND